MIPPVLSTPVEFTKDQRALLESLLKDISPLKTLS